jgi:cell division protein FtsB
VSSRKKPRFGLIILSVFIAYFIYIMAGQEKLIKAKQVEMKQVEAMVEEEKALNQELKNQKEEVNSDQYIEKVAREKLGLVKPGEKVFVDIGR